MKSQFYASHFLNQVVIDKELSTLTEVDGLSEDCDRASD